MPRQSCNLDHSQGPTEDRHKFVDVRRLKDLQVPHAVHRLVTYPDLRSADPDYTRAYRDIPL